jgi:cysteine peptidase C11 family protein
MQTKEWTLMFYFASDNPLASAIVSQLKALKEAGYHPEANVIAQFDPHAVNTPVHVFDVHHVNKFWFPKQTADGFKTENPFVRDLVLDRLWGEKDEFIRRLIASYVEEKGGPKFDPPKPYPAMSGEQDPKDALTNFLNFCRESYPARHYLLFILGHGQVVGNDTLLLDNHADRHALTLTELGQILRCFNADVQTDRVPGQVEMITLHCCSMSALEVAYELKGSANYMMASQGPMYVGNLPYRQILTRIFDDLTDRDNDAPQNGKPSSADSSESAAAFLRDRMTTERAAALGRYVRETPHPNKLISAVIEDFHSERNGDQEEIMELGPRSITTMLHKIYFDCLYNSYDFQLAGYPFDLCLTDLSKVGETKDPIDRLADSLIAGLKDKDPAPRQLILLAHWDAQSFYSEDYVDLYDFCYRLRKRCEERKDELKNPTLNRIYSACADVIRVLEKGDHNLINLSSFCGAAFQYSHGHSIYFPWSKPVDGKIWYGQYADYRLSRETKWRQFLTVYFEETMRKTRAEETGVTFQKDETPETQLKKRILALLGQIGSNALSADDRLQKPGPDHPSGKYGPDDPSGATCDCQPIKNYPTHTGEIEAMGQKVKIHVGVDFLDGTFTPIPTDG